jgi:hypothetical protein
MFFALAMLFGLDNDDVKTIGSAATSIGVLVALLGPAWKRWWQAPLLFMDYVAKQGDPHWDHVAVPGKFFFLRVRIRNARGSETAKNVEVIVADFRSGPLGLNGRSLEWSGQRPLNGEPVTKIDLAPGLSRHVDVAQISPRCAGAKSAEEPSDAINPDEARLCVYPKPWGAGHMILAGDHNLDLIVTATNANAVTYKMSLSYDGDMKAALREPPRATDRPFHHRVRSRIKKR